MPSAIREFVRDNSERLAALQKHLESLRREIDLKLDDVSRRIKVSDQPPLYPVIGPRPFNEEWPGRFTRIRYWELNVPGESNPAVNLRLCPKGWQVVAFRRDESDITSLLAAGGINRRLFNHRCSRGGDSAASLTTMPTPSKSLPRSNRSSTRCDNRQTHQHSGNLPPPSP